MKQLFLWAIVAFIIFWIVEVPGGASHAASDVGSFFSSVFSGLATLIGKV